MHQNVKILLPLHCTAQASKLVQMQIMSSLILKGFHFPSLFKCRRKCISSEVTISHLPCYPRIGSQAGESITNLKIQYLMRQHWSASLQIPSFLFFKAKQEMHHFRTDSRHQKDLQFFPRVGNIPTQIQKYYEERWRIGLGFKCLLTA